MERMLKPGDKLPKKLRSLFWDYDLEAIDLEEDKVLIIRRVLSRGSVEDLKWLRRTIGDEEIKGFLLKTKGRGIEKRRLRFYGVIFGLPDKKVREWLKDPSRRIWDELSRDYSRSPMLTCHCEMCYLSLTLDEGGSWPPRPPA